MSTQTRPTLSWRNETPKTTKCYRTTKGELVSVEKCEKIETAISALVMLYGEDFTKADERKIRKAIALVRSIQPDVEISNDPF